MTRPPCAYGFVNYSRGHRISQLNCAKRTLRSRFYHPHSPTFRLRPPHSALISVRTYDHSSLLSFSGSGILSVRQARYRSSGLIMSPNGRE